MALFLKIFFDFLKSFIMECISNKRLKLESWQFENYFFPKDNYFIVIFLTSVINNNSVQKNSVPKKRVRIESYILNSNHAGNDSGGLRQ